MQGVEILKQTEIIKDVFSCGLSNIPLTICMFLLMLISCFIFAKSKKEEIEQVFVIIFALSMLSGLVLMEYEMDKAYIQVPTGTYEYQITVSDDVTMNEFNEKYEIISQQGEIYTVVERN